MSPLSIDITHLAVATAGPGIELGLRAVFGIILLTLLVVVLAENAQENRRLRGPSGTTPNHTLPDEEHRP